MRELRQERGWGLSDLAGLARTSAGQLSNLEHGRRSPTTAVASTILDNLRNIGQECGPRRVLPVLVASAQTLRNLAVEINGARACAMWLLAARFAEYAGWMWQESGNHAARTRAHAARREARHSSGDDGAWRLLFH